MKSRPSDRSAFFALHKINGGEDMADQNEEVDIIDPELYEELEPEEMLELLEIERKKLKEKEQNKDNQEKSSFPRWFIALIAFSLFLNVIAVLPRTFSIPAIEFLITSSRLLIDEDVQMYKEAVVVVETSRSKGTGFGISEDGYIITNHHVVEGEQTVTINYPEEGLFEGKVIRSDETIDLALVKVSGGSLPYLTLADDPTGNLPEPILFIGNPLKFNGIANQGEWIGLTTSYHLDTEIMMLDAPIYRGNSGSPVINSDGEVVGVIYATTNDPEFGKIGLAVPIANVEQIFD